MKNVLGDFSYREKKLWSNLLIDIVVALNYYPSAFYLFMTDQATGPAMVHLIVRIIILAIIVSVLVEFLLGTDGRPEQKDERDMLFDARSSLWASRTLGALILLIIGLLVMQEGFPQVRPELFELTPLIIAHLLLFSLMISSLISSIVRLYFYRRGY